MFPLPASLFSLPSYNVTEIHSIALSECYCYV